MIFNTRLCVFSYFMLELSKLLKGNTIQKAINNMKDKYTILIIAHRLSTIVEADKIMLVEDGKVTSEGKHKELLKKNKAYKKLYENEILES